MDVVYNMQKEMLRRGYSNRTITTYIFCIKQFMKFYKEDLKKATKRDIKNYIDAHIKKNNTGNTINVNLNAIKFLMKEILNKKITLKIKYSKTPKTLPVYLTKEEIIKLFQAVENPKHKLILELIYSAGLRVSEVVNLRNCDLDTHNLIGWVRKGKGRKDRPFIIAKNLKDKLETYINENCERADSYLFTGKNNYMLSVRSVQEIVKKASKKARINKNVHPHSLRHSFATHLIQDGYDIVAIQPLLGHNSAETTLTYVHIAEPQITKVKSPYDSL